MTSTRENFDLKLDNLQIQILSAFTLELARELNNLLLDKTFFNAILESKALKDKYANLRSQVVKLLAYHRIEESRKIFTEIPEEELRNLNSDNKKYKKPFYQRSIRDFNLSTFTIILYILKSENLSEILLAIEMWTKVLDICMTEKDFHGTYLILSAINNYTISRLTSLSTPVKEFELLSQSARRILTSAKSLSDNNHRFIEENRAGSIPFLPMYCTWLNGLQEANQTANKVESEMSNRTKQTRPENDNIMSKTMANSTASSQTNLLQEDSDDDTDTTEALPLSTQSSQTNLPQDFDDNTSEELAISRQSSLEQVQAAIMRIEHEKKKNKIIDPLIQLRKEHIANEKWIDFNAWSQLIAPHKNIITQEEEEEDRPQLVRQESRPRKMLEKLSYAFKPQGGSLKPPKGREKINNLLDEMETSSAIEYWERYFEKQLLMIKKNKLLLIHLLASHEAIDDTIQKIQAIQPELNKLCADFQMRTATSLSSKKSFQSLFTKRQTNTEEVTSTRDRRGSWGPKVFNQQTKTLETPKASPTSRRRAVSGKSSTQPTLEISDTSIDESRPPSLPN